MTYISGHEGSFAAIRRLFGTACMTDAGQKPDAFPDRAKSAGESLPRGVGSPGDGAASPSVISSFDIAAAVWADEGSGSQIISGSSASILGLPNLDEPTLSGPFGPYYITRCLGRARRQASYLAVGSAKEKQVVLKTTRFAAGAGQEADAFHTAAQVVARIAHRNVCPVLGDGVIDGIHYYARAYIEGQPLAEFMQSPKLPPATQVAALVRKIAAAL